ncbi:hypothetical protein ACQW02_14235 [Humitalea sp. 24SJ18S-53]|uniref:hypothetical protein n=1 Tax=Humitalea sp. 24SJ18S-53 TaxID=3422307 RepID=UPI003D670246
MCRSVTPLALALPLLIAVAACSPNSEFQFDPMGAGNSDPSATFAGNGAWDGAGYAAGPGGGGFVYDSALGPGSEQ